MGRVSRRAAPLLLALLAGCGGLPTALAPLDAPAACQPPAPGDLSEATPEADLRCLVQAMRADAALGRAHGAQACALLVDRLPEGDTKAQIAAEGVRWGDAGEPTPAARYWTAVNLGVAIQAQPTLALKQLAPLEAHLKAAVEGAPATHLGGPLRVLGMLYLRAPAWPDGIGDGDKALKLLRRAAAEHPAHPLNPLFLATAEWEVEEDAEAATAALVAFERSVGDPRWAALAERWRADAAQLRSEL